jgi:hypothetical protein
MMQMSLIVLEEMNRQGAKIAKTSEEIMPVARASVSTQISLRNPPLDWKDHERYGSARFENDPLPSAGDERRGRLTKKRPCQIVVEFKAPWQS